MGRWFRVWARVRVSPIQPQPQRNRAVHIRTHKKGSAALILRFVVHIQFSQSARVEACAKSVMPLVSIANSRLFRILVRCAANHARWRFVMLRRQVTVSQELDPKCKC